MGLLAAGAVLGAIAHAGTPLSDSTHARLEAVWDGLSGGSGLGPASEEADAVFDAAIAYGGDGDVEPLREAAAARRLLAMLERSDGERLPDRVAMLRAWPELTRSLAFALRPEDSSDGVLGLMDRLNKSRPDDLRRYPELCTALLVVFDEPVLCRSGRPRPVPEGGRPPAPKEIDPLVVLDHFTANARKMGFDPAKLPAELAVFMVGLEVSPEDTAWALEKYGGDVRIGRHYDDVPYDTAFFERGGEMKIDRYDYTLPNLLRYGGICGDQAFFAESIAKACGVPAVTVMGTRGEIAHAWAGYLQKVGKKPKWNFDEGRYDEFDDVRASADDPQTHHTITTADLALLAQCAGVDRADRERAAALADAATRLADLAQAGGEGFPPPPPAGVVAGAPGVRAATVEASLNLSRAAVDLCPPLRSAWDGVTSLAAAGRLDVSQRRAWAEAADRFCTQDYPDFSADVLAAVIEGLPDPQAQAGLWDWAAKRFVRRPDLSAEMLMAKARMWEGADQKGKAYDTYLRIIDQFANNTPLAPAAVRAAEKLLPDGRERDVLALYAGAWKKVKKPSSASPDAIAGSNWYQIGAAYARRLDGAGQKSQADQVRRQLDPSRLRK